MSRFVFEVFRRITPLIAYCAECRLTPLLAHCADNKNLSSFENLSDTKGSLPLEKVPNCREFSLPWSNPPGFRENQMISYLSFWQP